ncbi:hypothetical protein [Leifsonia sp. 1010]|uniref:hypothetical protein n=1 Tax=Leifsonia sp. 1010 TaxID=2817769 RepID=UPI0028622765|nr:hypothetical protein [Leifsonia sp. 1010]MDR6612970.1 hypothetical protein [Leifsonia sp. 1010]
MMIVRSIGVVVFAAVMCVVLGGCVPGPTVMKTPRIVWQDGKRPSSELEKHPAVKLLRAAMIGDAMAWNSGDFTIKQLTETYEDGHSIVQEYEDQGDDPWVYRGPLPFEPVEVEEINGIDYDVTVCALPLKDWTITTPGHDWAANQNPSKPHLETWHIAKCEKLGLRVIGGGGGTDEDSCDGSTIPVGFFDPQPVVPKGPITKPQRDPFPDFRWSCRHCRFIDRLPHAT